MIAAPIYCFHLRRCFIKFAALLIGSAVCCLATGPGYLGRDVCAGCHKAVASTQAQTAMARTWQGTVPGQLPVGTSESREEGPDPVIRYLIERTAPAATIFTVQMPGQPTARFPVEVVMGGRRHGLSFLARVKEIEGAQLTRAPLVETRYLHYAPADRLELSPGFPKEKPASYETALGRVLTPHFEQKCLACHGEPRRVGTHMETGVTCESCHGPGGDHLAHLNAPPGQRGILNPRLLPAEDQMRPCAQCHAGFSNVQDPMPDDLLISDQVTALSNTECWRQSGGRIGCVNCHDPHADLPRAALIAKSEKTCLGCHSAGLSPHPALCPVNRSGGCVSCHMPESKDEPVPFSEAKTQTWKSKPFIISDHWIRVHPGETAAAAREEQPAWRSTVVPKHLFLRLIVLDDAAKADALRQQLASGASFFELARAQSLDRPSAANGGYLGDLSAPDLDPRWSAAALALRPGDVSPVVASGGQWFIVGRMPRNFREAAEARFEQAMDLRHAGQPQAAVAALVDALRLDPHLLRALTYLGISFGESGNPQTAAGVLSLATRLYPQDAGARFNLAIAEGAMGSDEELSDYRKALAIDPDYVPAYLNLGSALFNKGQVTDAIDAYRQGIEVNPLAASLHYSLGLALERANLPREAKAERDLAQKIDPQIQESGNHAK